MGKSPLDEIQDTWFPAQLYHRLTVLGLLMSSLQSSMSTCHKRGQTPAEGTWLCSEAPMARHWGGPSSCVPRGPSSSDMPLPCGQKMNYKECDFPNWEPRETGIGQLEGTLGTSFSHHPELLMPSLLSPTKSRARASTGTVVGPAMPQAKGGAGGRRKQAKWAHRADQH